MTALSGNGLFRAAGRGGGDTAHCFDNRHEASFGQAALVR